MSGFLKKLVHGISKVGEIAGPALTLTGIGAPIGMGITAASHIGDKLTDDDPTNNGLGSLLGAGALGAGEAGLAGLAGSKLGGMGGILNTAKTALGGGAGATGGTAGAGGSGGPDLGTLLKLLAGGGAAYGAVKGVQAAGKSASSLDSVLQSMQALAQQRAQQSAAMFADSSRLRTPATNALLSAVQAGPKASVDMSGFADSRNPFRSHFSSPAAAPPAGGFMGHMGGAQAGQLAHLAAAAPPGAQAGQAPGIGSILQEAMRRLHGGQPSAPGAA